MKLPLHACFLLLPLQAAAFQAQLHGKSSFLASKSTTRMYVAANFGEEESSKRRRLRNGVKSLLRKPDDYQGEVMTKMSAQQEEEVLEEEIVLQDFPPEQKVKVRETPTQWITSNGASAAQASLSVLTLDPAKEHKVVHMLGLMAGTLWWYVFSSYEFLTKPDIFDIFGIYSSGNQLLYYSMSAYVTISQLCTYFFLWKLMTTRSLREGQAWIGLCIFACVPADTIVILFDPTGSKSLTVLAFTLVTLIYGILLAFYLRQAAALEPNPTNNAWFHEGNDSEQTIWSEIIHYRPPADLQNTHMAIDFARSFGAFTVTVAAMRDQLSIGEVGWAYYATLIVVVAHSALEMTMTTITPGLDLHKYKSYLQFQAAMNLFQMFAATYIAHVAPEIDGDLSIWDDLVYSCLFGSAAAGFSEYVALLGENVDFDTKIGMANADISQK
jgi:hypothetical protein